MNLFTTLPSACEEDREHLFAVADMVLQLVGRVRH